MNIKNYVVLIIFSIIIDLVYSDILEDACNVYKGAVNSSIASIMFFDNSCSMIFKMPNQPIDNATNMCQSTVDPMPVNAACQLPLYDDINNLINKGLITTNDVFYMGVTRSGCGSWSYQMFNHTYVPITSINGISLPIENSDCEKTAIIYDKGVITPANKNTYPTTIFVCECYLTSSTASTVYSPINSYSPVYPYVSSTGAPANTYNGVITSSATYSLTTEQPGNSTSVAVRYCITILNLVISSFSLIVLLKV